MKSVANLLWITDPWTSLDHRYDSTLRLMQESVAYGYQTYWADFNTIFLEDLEVKLEASLLLAVSKERRSDDFEFLPSEIVPISRFQIIHYRVDPPVNSSYRYFLQLIFLGVRLIEDRSARTPLILNPPACILMDSEKLMQSLFPNYFPTSLVSSGWMKLLEFGRREGKTVVKPLGGTQSIGVDVLHWDTMADVEVSRSKVSRLTRNFRHPVLLQKYLKGVEKEEIRLWFLRGELLVSVKKVKNQNVVFNIDQGSSVYPCELNDTQFKIVDTLSGHLKATKIFTAAIDLIDNQIIDYNITSPGLIVHIEEATNRNIALEVMEAHREIV